MEFSPSDSGFSSEGSSTESTLFYDMLASSQGVMSPDESEVLSNDKKKTKWVRDYALPPCRVCGRDGSGLHYGVNTCTPCKGFFQRSFVNQNKYVCRGDNRCQLLKSRRNTCSLCRLQKCLDVGMSKDGIRHGRYLLDKRLQDIQEIKQLQSSQAIAAMLVEEERKRPSVEKFVVCILNNRTKYSKVCDTVEKMTCEMDLEYMRRYDFANVLVDDFIRLYSGNSTEPGMVSLGSYFDCTEIVARRLIKFAKSIPGFRDLKIEDQMTLLQDSNVDSRIVHGLHIYRLILLSESNLQTILGDAFGRYLHKLCQKYYALKLRPEEIAVLMAFVLFNTANSRLIEPDKVEAMHNQLLDTLQWLLKRNHPDDKMIFCKIVEVLTSLRLFSKFDEDITTGAFKLMENGGTKLPQLLRELNPPDSRIVDLNCTFASYYERYML